MVPTAGLKVIKMEKIDANDLLLKLREGKIVPAILNETGNSLLTLNLNGSSI